MFIATPKTEQHSTDVAIAVVTEAIQEEAAKMKGKMVIGSVVNLMILSVDECYYIEIQ